MEYGSGCIDPSIRIGGRRRERAALMLCSNRTGLSTMAGMRNSNDVESILKYFEQDPTEKGQEMLCLLLIDAEGVVFSIQLPRRKSEAVE